MNYRGSYRHLLKNSKAAMVAAIEIYNKPSFSYRDECFVILLLNAWELILKAVLSKQKLSVFYPKKRKEPYRTLSWRDAITRAESYFPKELSPLPVRRNLDLLSTYRDNAVHFYNADEFGVLIYALAQTSVINYKDLLATFFKINLENEISWQLLPIGLKPPVDAIQYISKKRGEIGKGSPAVNQFLTELAAATAEISDAGLDTGRLLTVFSVSLQSTKKIDKADVIVGVQKVEVGQGPLVVTRTADPNITHPLRQKDVVASVRQVNGTAVTSHVFTAVAWKYDIKNQPRYCWRATGGVLTRYSNDTVTFIKQLSADAIKKACIDYRKHLHERSRSTSRKK
jgi:Protein of unknown function (DUF3644).